MKLDIVEKIEVPEGMDVKIERGSITLKSGDKENTKKFDIGKILMSNKEKEIIVEAKKATKREIKMIKTIKAHIINMIKGLQEGFEYKLEAVFVHFPMTLNKENSEIIIKNFFGGKKPLSCKILEGTEVEIDKNFITVKSPDKELAGQMAANLERTTKLRKKDRRKFQDGIFIVEKPGREI